MAIRLVRHRRPGCLVVLVVIAVCGYCEKRAREGTPARLAGVEIPGCGLAQRA